MNPPKPCKLALITIPKHGVNVPPLALSYLSAAVRRAGFSVIAKDFNVELYEATVRGAWSKIWFETNVTLYKDPAFSTFVNQFYESVLDQWAEEIANFKSEWLGISCFSYRSIPTLRLLVPKIRARAPGLKIVIGGAPITQYGPDLIREGLADAAVVSEGEIALVELLNGNWEYPGILSPRRLQSVPVQINDLDQLALPDYTGVDFGRYTPGDPGGLIALKPDYDRFGQQAGIMASRGCVRRCTFCDVESYWPKFRWRSSASIVSEMRRLYDDYGVREIYFHDSLINGNLATLQELLHELVKLRNQYPFILRGLAIIRQQPASLYPLFEEAGFVQLQIGVESFSERVREDMRKKFSNQLLAENLEAYAKTNIKIILLLMAGYPTETQADQAANLRWLEQNQHFNMKPIWRIDWGGTALILPGSPLFKENRLSFYSDQDLDWVHVNGSEVNNFELRVNRLREAEEYARVLGWRVGTSYAGGEVVIGDFEKGTFASRPQDQYPGWAADPTRANVGYAHDK